LDKAAATYGPTLPVVILAANTVDKADKEKKSRKNISYCISISQLSIILKENAVGPYVAALTQ